MIVVIDYGMGNIGSIISMLRHLGVEALSTSDPGALSSASGLVLPGVGSFDEARLKLEEAGMIGPLEAAVSERAVPILGICLGFQLMTQGSEEGRLAGLGWFQARTVKFELQQLRVPHVGWNQVRFNPDHPLSEGMDDSRFFFLHSYFVQPNTEDTHQILCRSEYGGDFVAGLCRQNIFGVQFHPEKSHKFGKRLFSNFLELTRNG